MELLWRGADPGWRVGPLDDCVPLRAGCPGNLRRPRPMWAAPSLGWARVPVLWRATLYPRILLTPRWAALPESAQRSSRSAAGIYWLRVPVRL